MRPPLLSSEALGWAGSALRTWVASLLALYVAFALQLDAPYWAFLTVWVVVQPTVGMQLSKSVYRVMGTVIGTIFGVLLIACFAQTPALFLLALSALIGITTILSNLSGNYVSYAFALTGYTAAIVAIGAIPKPENIFFIAAARMSCILLGIGCVGLVAALFAPHHAEQDVRKKLLNILKDVARQVAFPLHGDQEARSQLGTHLLNDITSADSLIEYASAESGIFRLQAGNARSLLVHAIGMITAHRAVEPYVKNGGVDDAGPLRNAYLSSIALFERVPTALDENDIDGLISTTGELRRQVEALLPEESVLPRSSAVSERILIDRLNDLFTHTESAFNDWCHIERDDRRRSRTPTLNFSRDQRAARIAGFRAFVGVYAVGLFWMLSAWPHGSSALLIMAVVMSLLSSTPQPALATWVLFLSSLAASVCAIGFKFLILSRIEGFETFIIMFAFIAIPLGLAMAYPKTSAKINGFALIFISVIAPTNPMVFKLSDSLNSAVGLTAGALFGVVAYVIIFPADPQATRRYIFYRVKRGVELLASARSIPSHSAWETRMYDRANRLHTSSSRPGVPHDEATEAALGALALGNELIRLRWLARESLSAELQTSVTRVINAFTQFRPLPQRAATEVRDRLDQLSQLDPGSEPKERRVRVRVRGALTEINRCLVSNPVLCQTNEVI